MPEQLPTISKLFQDSGFRFFTNGDLNLNFFGIRSSSKVNAFDDVIGLCYKEKGVWVTKLFPATTDAGSPILGATPSNPKGVAVLPQSTVSKIQYRFKIGTHKGEYPALNQDVEFPVLRDNNRDNKFLTRDEIISMWKSGKSIDKGYHGINCHHASDKVLSVNVGNWSHGCQVIQDYKHWVSFWDIITRSSKIYGDVITYTLFDEEDLKKSLGMDVRKALSSIK